MRKVFFKYAVVVAIIASFLGVSYASDGLTKEDKRKEELDRLQKRFEWWPTDARPGPVKDPDRGGYWWWPTTPGEMRPWGNRGYVYVYKIIFDYKEEELPAPKKKELRPSLLIKKIVKNVKVYFDFDKADLRDDAKEVLETAASSLKKNSETSVLITGNCDIRGTEKYNEKLGRQRGESVKQFMLDKGIPEDRIKIVSRGKLDAIAPVTDLVGMAKDRNAQFMIAEVEEVMIPYPGSPEGQEVVEVEPAATQVEEGKYIVEKEEVVESEIKVETKEYIVKPGDTLSKIAQKELGDANRWKNIYELNKKKIKNPNKLSAGKKLVIPIE